MTDSDSENMNEGRRSRSRSPNKTASRERSRDIVRTTRVFVNNLAFQVKWQDLKDYMRQCGEVQYVNVLQDQGRSKGCGIVEFATVEEAELAITELDNTELMGRVIYVREDREREKRPQFRETEPRERVYRDERDSRHARESRDDRDDRGAREYREPRERDTYRRDDSPKKRRESPARRSEPRENRERREPREPRAPRERERDDDVQGRQLFVGNLPYSARWQDLKDLFRDTGRVERADVFMDGPNRSKGCGIVVFESPSDAERAIDMLNDYEWNGRRIDVRLDQRPTKPRY